MTMTVMDKDYIRLRGVVGSGEGEGATPASVRVGRVAIRDAARSLEGYSRGGLHF